MKKQDIKADWTTSGIYRRPTWSAISSRELSEVLGVSMNTICNWRLRRILPEPVTHPRLKGNRVYYRISAIQSWLTGESEDFLHWRWLESHFDLGNPFASLKQAEEMVLLCYDIYEVEKPLIPGNFSSDQRNPRLLASQEPQGVDESPAPARQPLEQATLSDS